MSAAYPPTKPRNYDRSLARRLAILQAIDERLRDAYLPERAQSEMPGRYELAAYRLASIVDSHREATGRYLATDGDFLQILYALGTHCVFHGTAFVDSDPDRRTCLPCEFETADRRYQGHTVIPYLPGELVNA